MRVPASGGAEDREKGMKKSLLFGTDPGNSLAATATIIRTELFQKD